MKLIFLFGPAAAGKLTVGRELAALTGIALFHNHLIVDAVGAVFPFGSPTFIALRERFWIDVFTEAAKEGRSLIFTFAPEDTVASDFPQRVKALIQSLGGEVVFVGLTVAELEQERRIAAPSRSAFGKLTSLELLRELRQQFNAAMAAMPEPIIMIDTSAIGPEDAARAIARAV
jgi:hypothetical protein